MWELHECVFDIMENQSLKLLRLTDGVDVCRENIPEVQGCESSGVGVRNREKAGVGRLGGYGTE